MRFLIPVATVIAASSTALAAPPTTPSGLRVDVYSDTAAELFWNRSTDPDGAVSGYEIRRDGQFVVTRDGTSHFTEALAPGRSFGFTVTAVDIDGERSAPASIEVGVRGTTSGTSATGPAAPTDLRSEVYSTSAAEVFWRRGDGRAVRHEVSVDGGPVRTTDGTSAFLSDLPGARGRTVEVVAIDADGRRSSPASVTLGGGSGGGNPAPPAIGVAPSAPSNLRAELYSPSAGEVFWDRGPDAGLSYEVSIGGEVVATTTGTSRFIDGRANLAGSSVGVVAIASDGTRSSVSTTTIGTGDVSPTDPGPDPAPESPSVRIEGQELVGDLRVEGFTSRGGIGVSVQRYGFSRFGDPEIGLRLTNGSGGPIYNANCDVAALSDNTIVDTANAFFARLDPIDFGESAVDDASWRNLGGGFGSIDRIRIDCDWIGGDGGRIDVRNGPVTVDFGGYRSSFTGRPAVALRLTNGSGQTIYNVACGVEAKRGNVILDVAQLFFADLGNIRPGEAAEEQGTWFELDSLGDFDAEPFDLDDVNCSRLVR